MLHHTALDAVRRHHHVRSTSWTPQDLAQAAVQTTAPFFNRPHPVVSFGFGGRIAYCVPSQSAFRPSSNIKIGYIPKILANTPTITAYSSFPGPLTSSSSKDAILRFISEKSSEDSADPEASKLLWELLRLLVTNHGTLVGDPEIEKATVQVLASSITSVSAQLTSTEHPNFAALSNIQQLILSGNRADACRTAMESQLWAHALLLSYGSKDFPNVMASFANSALPEGSPLRTLYLVMAQQPQSLFSTQGQVASVLDNWKENLTAILNTTGTDRRPMVAELGDRLWGTKNRVEAAHCCYLLADLPFSGFDNPGARIVLLGGDHKRRAGRFATCEAIQRSEIYEWAHLASNSQYTLHAIYPYKLLYAWQLAEIGFVDSAHRYVEKLMAAEKAGKGTQALSPHYLYQLHVLEERIRGLGAVRGISSGGRWLPRVISKGINLILGEGGSAQPAPASSPARARAAPVPTTPPPAKKESKQDTAADDYANAFSTAKKEPAIAPAQAAKNEDEQAENKGDDAGKKGKWFSFPKWGKSGGKEAKLGDENAFEYNEELKMWVEKGKPLPVIEATPPPPPAAMTQPPEFTPPPGSGVHTEGESPNSPGPGMNKYSMVSPINAGGKRKPRYVDTLNQGTIHNHEQLPPTNARPPPPVAPGFRFTPTAQPDFNNIPPQ